MEYKLYCLEFLTGVHFGSKNLDSTEITFHADTLFAALFQEALKMEKQKEFLNAVSEGRIVLSDAFPYIGKNYYIPKPMISVRVDDNEKQGNSRQKKMFKNLKYIPVNTVEAFINGTFPEEHMEDMQYLGTNGMKVSVGIRGMEENKKKILFEYLLALDLKVKRGEYADFIRGITPLIIDLLEMVLEQFCKINVTQYYKKKERKWDRYKLDGTEVLGIMNEKFYPFRYGIVYSSHLQPIIEKKCKDDLLKQRTKGLVEIEQNVRNIAAHNIVSATPEWVKEQAGRSVEDILWLLKYICEQVKINTRKENWDSYDYMNKRIIEELDR